MRANCTVTIRVVSLINLFLKLTPFDAPNKLKKFIFAAEPHTTASFALNEFTLNKLRCNWAIRIDGMNQLVRISDSNSFI